MGGGGKEGDDESGNHSMLLQTHGNRRLEIKQRKSTKRQDV